MPVEQLIFTDRPRGKGVDPASAGYQIKACSAALSAEARELLSSICMHYGDAVYRYAPRAAIDRETSWRTQTASLDAVPDHVLKEFPVIWSYDRLHDDRYALTRVCYAGLTHDRRPGNFFAHSLIFALDDLAPHGYNPLALARSELFRSNDISDDTILPALADLSTPTDIHPSFQLLNAAPYRDHLAAMASALCAATPATRPVVVCLADWRQAAPLVEALLGMLPPSARCRTTVATYESDRTWVANAKFGRSAGVAAAHHLLVLGGADERSFNLRPDEYRSVYAVFNFADSQYSEIGAPCRFAVFAADCITSEHPDRLAGYHALVEQLGYAHDVNAWDSLAPAAALLDTQLGPAALAEATHSLAALTTQPEQVQIALDLLVPHIRALAQANDAAALLAIAGDLPTLVNRAIAGTPERAEPVPFLAEVQLLAKQAFARGQGRSAALLLTACGQARESTLLALLNDAAQDGQATTSNSSNVDDRAQVVELLLDGLRLAEKNSDVSSAQFAGLLVLTFRLANEVDLAADVWNRLGESLVKPRLSGEWDAEKQALGQELVRYLPASRCPDANIWLNMKLIEAANPQGVRLLAMLVDLAHACSQSSGAAERTADLLRIAQERFSEKEQRVLALGRMAEAAYGTAVGDTFIAAYLDAIDQIRPDGHNRIHQKLAEAGVANVLHHELLKEVLPWNGEESQKKLQPWRDGILRANAPLMNGLRQQVAALLGTPGRADSLLPLARELIPRQQSEAAASPGLAALYNAVARALPLEPLPDKWSQTFASMPGGLASEAAARLRVLKFMSDIKQRTGEQSWSTTTFPHADTAWSRDLLSLGQAEQAQMLEWCIGTFAATGVTTPEEAVGLVRLLSAAGVQSPTGVADALDKLLAGRDPVTYVLVATAFARCALESAKQPEIWAAIVGALLERFDKETRRLFEAHLIHRFARRGQKYDERLDQLCVAVGLSRPKPIASPPKTADAAAPSLARDQQPSVAGILDSAKRHWRRFVGGTETPEEPSAQPGQSGKEKRQ